MTAPAGNREFCLPSASMLPSASPQEILRASAKQNSLFPQGQSLSALFTEIRF